MVKKVLKISSSYRLKKAPGTAFLFLTFLVIVEQIQIRWRHFVSDEIIISEKLFLKRRKFKYFSGNFSKFVARLELVFFLLFWHQSTIIINDLTNLKNIENLTPKYKL
jgi:hypothetical protein